MVTDNKKINVLITAMGGGGHGEQILKAFLADPMDNICIYGADSNPHCPQFQHVEKSFTLPYANDPAYLDTLLKICREHNIKALFHGCEPELKLFSCHRDVFASEGIFLPINPQDVIDTCMDKVRTAYTLQKAGFETPAFMRLNNFYDLSKVDFFPLVLKPAIGGGGSANCYIVQNMNELEAIGQFLHLGEEEQYFMAQEYVGTPEDEYTVGVLLDMNGNIINSIAVRRLLKSQLNIRLSVPNRTSRKDLGPNLVISSGISHGYVDRFPEVTSQCEEIARKIGATGPLNIQCRFVDGKVQVFEINPRFSGTTSVRALMGYNEPVTLINKHLFGQDIEFHFPYKSGWVIRNLQETVL